MQPLVGPTRKQAKRAGNCSATAGLGAEMQPPGKSIPQQDDSSPAMVLLPRAAADSAQSEKAKKALISRASAENLLDLRLLITAQCRAYDRAAIAAELIGDDIGIAHAQDCVNG